jgi:hypothetical protein
MPIKLGIDPPIRQGLVDMTKLRFRLNSGHGDEGVCFSSVHLPGRFAARRAE